MTNNQTSQLNSPRMTPYLSSIGAWALAFGCIIGWGVFIMPGTSFLPIAGPFGTVLGISIGALIMLVFGVNYSRLINRYPNAGGSFTYAKELLGADHGFLCGWMLMLAYLALLWANATALTLIVRCFAGDLFCFGFAYSVFGYEVYLGEVLLSVFLVIAGAAVCVISRNLSKWIVIICSLTLFLGICATFAAVVIHRGGLSDIAPLFQNHSPEPVQVISIVLMAPWAFIGFETISHSSEEFRFSKRKVLPIIAFSIIAALISYAALTLCAGCVHPDGYDGWMDYIADLSAMEGVAQMPTFYSAQEALGSSGVLLLGFTAICAVVTSIFGYYIAASRLIFSMASDKMLPKIFLKQNKRGTPVSAIVILAAISCVVPLFGRIAIGWIVDVVTIGATVVYAYVCICNIVVGKREKKTLPVVWGFIGAFISITFVIFYLIPSFHINTELASQSYMILIMWSVLGIVVFRVLIGKDKKRRMGKTGVVWLVLFFLLLVVSISWIVSDTAEENIQVGEDIRNVYYQHSYMYRTAPNENIINSTGEYITRRMTEFGRLLKRNYYIQAIILLFSVAVIFSIFSMIRRRETDLEDERIRAEENSRAKTIFLSNMSHDIRTPMNAVTGYTALALKQENLPDNIRVYLEKIDASGNHLLSLINDILDMSRIESGKMELSVEPCDLIGIFDEVEGIFALQMQSKGLTFSFDYSKVEDRYVLCDVNRVKRILLNLISNAYKFTPEGSVTVTVVQTGREETKGNYRIVVRDTGIGMSEEFAQHVFDAFERERTSTVSQVQGTGLGMSIAKSLTEMMGGTIQVETAPQVGTAFTIDLQFELTDQSQVETDDIIGESDILQNKGKKLLVVEDNPINSEIACEILRGEGYETDVAENGKMALEKILSSQAGTYSLVLMDIQMPVMNGYEAAQAIRAIEDERSGLPIIALSANSFDEDRRKAEESGMNGYVSKPFKPEELIAAVRKYTM